MMGKLYSAIAVFCIATILSTSGIVGYLVSADHLTPQRWNVMVETLRGQHDDLFAEPNDPEGADAADPQQDQPLPTGQRTADALRAQLDEQQLLDARFERAMGDLAARKELLDQTLQELITRGEQFDARRQAWIGEQDRLRNAVVEEGFKAALETVEKMAPKQAKEHFIFMWNKEPADAVRMLNALSPSRRQRILDQFKTAEETQVMNGLLERLRLLELDSFAPESGKTGGNTG